jgi:hypothetical protein
MEAPAAINPILLSHAAPGLVTPALGNAPWLADLQEFNDRLASDPSGLVDDLPLLFLLGPFFGVERKYQTPL